MEQDTESLAYPLSAEEMVFLEDYPLCKEELEVDIGKLQALADHIDSTHKNLTKTHVAAHALAVVSGALNILGLLLVPATAGGSLLLSAASKGLGTAAGVTGILSDVWGHFHKRGARAQASNLVPAHGCEVSEAQDGGTTCVVAASQLVYDYGSAVQDLRKNIRALQIARARPRLVRAAKRLQASGQVSARRSRQVHSAFGGTPLAMGTNARWLGSLLAGFSLGLDVTNLQKVWTELQEGARTELAEALRAQAWELEKKLAELIQRHEHLQQVSKPWGRERAAPEGEGGVQPGSRATWVPRKGV